MELPDNCYPSTLSVRLHCFTGPHILQWDEPVHAASDRAGEPVLPAGSCNLYLYPQVVTELEPRGITAKAEGVHVLHLILMDLAKESDRFDQSDGVGAYPIHCLMIRDSEASLKLAGAIFEAVPRMLTLLHGDGLYKGESSLHVAIVNQHEDLFLHLLDLAIRNLSTNQVETLLHSQASGPFFDAPPMRMYGGTVLSYACCFSMYKAVKAMLDTRLVSLNSRCVHAHACMHTPTHMHACIQSSRGSQGPLL